MSGEVALRGRYDLSPVSNSAYLKPKKLGFSNIIVPRHNLKGFDTSKLKIQITEVAKVEEAFRALFA